MNTPIDFTPLLSKLAMGGVVVAVLSIAGSLLVIYVARTGVSQFLRVLFNKYENAQQNNRFEQRYRREKKNSDYRAWKKSKGRI